MKSKKNKICVIGAGGWGKNHINTLNRLGNLYGIVDKDKNILNNYNEGYQDCNFHNSVEEAISFGYDGYVISTPAETHFELANLLLNKSKNVLIEKPVCLSYKDSKVLLKQAKNNNCFIMGGHLLLFHPAYLKMKELLKDDAIGEVRYIYSNRLNFGKVRNYENALWSLAPHDISLILLFNNYPIINTKFNSSKVLNRKIEDSTIFTLNFSNKVDAHIFISWLHPFKEHRFVIIGDKGMMVYEDSKKSKKIDLYNSYVSFEKNNIFDAKMIEGEKKEINFDNSSPLDNELNYFIESIENNSTDYMNYKLSMEVVDILEKVSEK
tara:strand:+ start:1388 stop:2356 length:969 start_codon:yes stop_codon:yes gene_type:complete